MRRAPASRTVGVEPGDEPRSEQAAGDVRVWIERDGLRGPMDELVLERFALVAKSAPRERSPRAPSELADPSSLELILTESEPEAGRSVALRRLGLSPEAPVVMLAIADPAGEAVAPASVEELLRALAPHVRARGALRMAGQALHMHHSSVASRLARLEERLRLDLTLPADLFQARLCLYAATLAGNV